MLRIKVTVKSERWNSISGQRRDVIAEAAKFIADASNARIESYSYTESPITQVPRVDFTLSVR